MSSFDSHYAMWPAQREQRDRLNDELREPRIVEHFAFSRRRRDARNATQELASAGYDVRLGRRRFTSTLQALRTEPLTDGDVARFLTEVITVVDRHRGEYDGWGAPVEAPSGA